MLHKYSFSNFQSFSQKIEIDFTSSRTTQSTDLVVKQKNGSYVSKVLMVIGSNASGKTSLIKPLAFINWFIAHSFSLKKEESLPFFPHKTMSDQSTSFSFEREANGEIWRYSVTMTRQRVLNEMLEILDSKTKRFNYAFKRMWLEKTKKYEVKQRLQFDIPLELIRLLGENVSFLSWAKQYGNPLAEILLYEWECPTNLTVSGRESATIQNLSNVANYLQNTPKQLEQVNKLLKSWDFGLSYIKIGEFIDVSGKPILLPIGVHHAKNEEFELVFTSESHGTQSALLALIILLPALSNGNLIIFDELEANLHPHMIEPILRLFESIESNPNNAQLIFTSHSLEAMNLLQKSQIILVEKNQICESDAWRLDDIEGVRTDDNFYAKYMAGAYSAVPNIE